MLYASPTASDFKVLTHSSTRRFQKNGFSQVGNTLVPANEISKNRVTPSAIYSKGVPRKFGVSGIGEAGYGRRYPNPKGLSLYRGAGSYGTSGSKLSYYGAGSYGAAGSKLAYAGAGSYGASGTQSGSRLAYAGAGSEGAAGSQSASHGLNDAYINDNPTTAELTRYGLRGLSEGETPEPSLFQTITGAFKSLTETTIKQGSTAANQAISNAINPPPKPPSPIVTTVVDAAKPITTALGMPLDTLLMGGALLVGGYFLLKKI